MIESKVTFATAKKANPFVCWRGAGVVTEQIANLSASNRRQGSNPCLSAFFSGCSVARSSRLVWDQEVAGSNPATPTKGELQKQLSFFYVCHAYYLLIGLKSRMRLLNRKH